MNIQATRKSDYSETPRDYLLQRWKNRLGTAPISGVEGSELLPTLVVDHLRSGAPPDIETLQELLLRVQSQEFSITDLFHEFHELESVLVGLLEERDGTPLPGLGRKECVRGIAWLGQAFEVLLEYSSALYEYVAERSGRAFCLTDTQGHITFANQPFKTLFQVHDYVGLPLAGFFDPVDADFVQESLRRDRSSERDLRFRRADGKEVVVVVQLQSIVTRGRQIGGFAILTDISDRVSRERDVLERSTLGVVEVDREETIVYANRMAEKTVGRTPLEGTSLRELIVDPKSRDILEQQLKLRRSGDSSEFSLQIMPLDGSRRNPILVAVAGVPILDRNDEWIGSLAILRDLTLEQTASQMRDIIERERDYNKMIRAVADSLRKVLPFDILSLAVYSSSKDENGFSTHVRSLVDVCNLDPVPPELKPPASYYKVWYYLPPSEEMAKLLAEHEIQPFPDLEALLEIEAFSPFKKDRFVQGLLAHGFHSGIRIPVFEGERLVAALTLFRSGKGAFGTEEATLLDHLPLRAATSAAYFRFRDVEKSFQHRLLRDVLECNSTEEVAGRLTRAIQQHYGWGHVSIFRVDYQLGRVSLLRQEPDLIPSDYSQPLQDGVLGQVLSDGRSDGINIGHLDNSELADRYVALPQKNGSPERRMESEISLPIAWEGKVRWLFNAEDSRENAFAEDERNSLSRLLRQTGGLLEQMAWRYRLSGAFDMTSDALINLDEDNRVQRLNGAAERLLGTGAKGRGFGEFLPATPKSRVILNGASLRNTEIGIRGADERETKVLLSVSTLSEDTPGRLLVAKDLSGLRREQELRSLEKVFYEIAFQTQAPLALATSRLDRLVSGDTEGESPRGLANHARQQLGKVQLTLEKMAMYHDGESLVPVEPIRIDLPSEFSRVLRGLPKTERSIIQVSGPETLLVRADLYLMDFVLRSLLTYLVRGRASGTLVSVNLSQNEKRARVDLSCRLRDPRTPNPDKRTQLARVRAMLALGRPLLEALMQKQGGTLEEVKTGNGEVRFSLDLPEAG